MTSLKYWLEINKNYLNENSYKLSLKIKNKNSNFFNLWQYLIRSVKKKKQKYCCKLLMEVKKSTKVWLKV